MSFKVVVPARYQSTRLPGKPLLLIAGKPMIQHVYERARLSGADAVYIATDDERIASACRNFGASVCLTSASHASGTDRIEEVCRQLNLADEEIVINIQGDEPLIPPMVIDQVARNIARQPDAGICSLYEPIKSGDGVNDPNVVKVVVDNESMALYFSRAPIPYSRDGMQASADLHYKRHIGIYAYRVSVLKRFVSWPSCTLEEIEKLEQLRALVNGVRIHMARCSEPVPAGVDTEHDLEQVRSLLEKSK